MQRLVSLDIAKALCIILVVIGHYFPDNAPAWYVCLHDAIYMFHMPLFMFASGYIYNATQKEIGYGAFISKKVKRLLIPYFSVSFIVITIKLLTQGNALVENPVTIMSYLQVFWLPSAGFFLWFIWALWWIFVLIPVFKTKQSRMVLFVLSIILFFLPVEFPSIFCLAEFKDMLIYFMLGVVCYDNKELFSVVVSRFPFSGIVIFAVCVIVNQIYGSNEVNLYFIPAFAGILMTMQLSRIVETKTNADHIKWLMQLSASSYMIYLFHTTFEGLAKSVCHKIPFIANGTNDASFIVGAVIIISCGVIVPVLLHNFVLSRTRVTRFLFGLK